MKILASCWDAIKSPNTMTVLAVVGFGLAIFLGFFYEKKGELTITNDAVSRVFDVHQPVGGLEISYAGENLRTSKKALWTLSFTVKNSGNAEIRKGDYDDAVPFGFQFVGAEVVEIPTIKTSVEYLSKNLKISKTSNFVGFSPVIFEPNDEVQINVLLLGSEAAKPTFSATGKIAGLRSINMNSPDQRSTEKGFWASITDADIFWVHPARSFVYGVAGLISLMLVAGLVAGASAMYEYFPEKRALSKRRKEAGAYKPHGALDSNSRALLNIYVSDGPEALGHVANVIETINKRLALCGEIGPSIDQNRLNEVVPKVYPLRRSMRLLKLKESGLVSGEKSSLRYSEGLDVALTEVAQVLKIDITEQTRRAQIEEANYSRHQDLYLASLEARRSPESDSPASQ
jgi:hypothetical protein